MSSETTSLKQFLDGRSHEDYKLLLSAAIHSNRLSQEAYGLQRQQVARVQVSRWWSLLPSAFVLWSLQFTDLDNVLHKLGAIALAMSAIVAGCSIFSRLRAIFAAARIKRAIKATNKMSFENFGAYFPPAQKEVAELGPQAATLGALDGVVYTSLRTGSFDAYPQYFRIGSPYPPWSFVAFRRAR